VTVFHKANVLKVTTGLFRRATGETFDHLSQEDRRATRT
jgi:isocitrate/isopropylmalate dehydrogenase